MANATLIAHCGSEYVTRQHLETIPTPEATATWRPVGHSELVDVLFRELDERDIWCTREQYALGSNNAKLFAVFDLRYQTEDEFTSAIGLRTSNDKSMAIELAIGLKVFVCDNLSFSGDMIALKRKHTSRLNLEGELKGALDRYEESVPQLYKSVDRLKNFSVKPLGAKEVIFDIFEQGIMPSRLFPAVCQEYRDTRNPVNQQISGWGLHNAFTKVAHQLKPRPKFETTVGLGRYFQMR